MKVHPLTAVTLLAIIATASAQEHQSQQAPPTFAIQLSQIVARNCPNTIQVLTDGMRAQQIVALNPINTSAVCRCVEGQMLGDRKLLSFLDVDIVLRGERFRQPDTQAYFSARISHATLSCLLPQVELSLAAFPLK